MSVVLLVRLKITDLAAWSALESGRRLLAGGHSLSRIVREQVYLFEPASGSEATSFERALEEAVLHSNFFVNPNKESYRLVKPSERGEAWSPPEGAWGILTRPREETRDERLIESLRREHPMPGLGSIRRAKVWWLWTGGDPEHAASALGELRDSKHGLLVNPHAEAAMIVTGPVPWTRVERFLIDPAPEYRAAA